MLASDGSVESIGKLGRTPADIREYRLFRKQVTDSCEADHTYRVGVSN